MKLDKIEQDIKRTRAKITEYQNRLKELEVQKTEQENLEIIQLVRTLRMTKDELTAFLQGGASPAAVTPTTAADTDYYTTQEDSENEE